MLQQSRDRAQGLVEYGLIIALVAVIAIAGLIIFGPAVRTCKNISSGFLGTSGQVVGWRRVQASTRRVTN